MRVQKVLFVIESLNAGGAERTLLETVKALKDSCDITVFALYEYPDEKSYVDDIRRLVKYRRGIKYYSKGSLLRRMPYAMLSRIRQTIWRCLSPRALHRLLVKDAFDIEIAFLEGRATRIVSGAPSHVKKIAWVHTDVIGNPWADVYFRNNEEQETAYKAFEKVFAVSEFVADSVLEKFGVQATFIQNIVDDASIIKKSLDFSVEDSVVNRPLLVSVGRIDYVKGYDRLIEAIARLKAEGFLFEVRIMGDGVQRKMLVKRVEEYGLNGIITFVGFCENPYPFIRAADLYICPSRSEGFSGSITEALILGTPVLATRCAGMKELLGENEYGLIVENSEEGIYRGLQSLLVNRELLASYKNKAAERGKDFSNEMLSSRVAEAIGL